jgi:hypothetical protein
MRASVLASLVFLTAIGCGHSILSASTSLDGQWEWQFNLNPAGSRVSLSLTTAGSAVSGTGTICGVGPACSPGAVTITGQSTGMSVQLTIRGGSGFVATYAGHLVGPNELEGTWVEGMASNTVIFYRQ